MCGIAGEVGRTPDDDALRAMVDSMRRRGPDGEGYVVEDRAALGMCRLAIIDVAGGEQPIATADGRWQIVYNGECYGTPALRRELEARGHRFRTRTDTEVVLHAVVEWGVAGLDRLNGMFAFAIWDRRDRELLLVRDRLGVKPLFYWAAPDRLVFSSTMTAIAGRPDFRGTIDPEAVELYLAHKFVTAPHTMYREIRKLPAGHVLRWRDGRADVQRWWDVPIGAPRRIGLDEAAEEVDARLADAARIRLVSERPVGLCLSGGVDSGLLAHALRDQRTETFSLGFADADYDEAPVAARVARALELPHHVLRAELDAERDLDDVLRQFDEPVADPSGVALYELSRLVSRHVTVVLSGTGGDELFGGYRRVLAGLLARVTQHAGALRALPRLLGRDETRLGWRGQVARLAAAAGAPPLDTYRRLLAPGTGDLRRPELVRALDGFTAAMPFEQHFARHPDASLLTRLLYTDLKTVLAEQYLVKEDRMTMAHSVEGRVPFLDYRLVELAFSLPDDHKVRGLTGKVLLRRLARAHLPAEVSVAPKQGFEVPIAAWLRGALAPRVRALLDRDARVHAFVAPRAVATLVREHLEARADHGRMLWTLLTLEAWLRRSSSTTATPPSTRLMIVSSSLGEGGAQRVTSTLLAHLDRARFAPSLCVFKPTVTFPVPDDVPVHVVGGARDEPLATRARTRPWLVGGLLRNLRRRLVDDRPDVVLSNIDQVSTVTAVALAGLASRPRWIARVGSAPAHQGRLEAAASRWALRRADAIVVSSEALAAGVAAAHPGAQDRLRVLPNATDFDRIDRLAAETPSRLRSTAPLVIAVGRLSPEKRPDLMLDAIARLGRVRLWLCGDGPLAATVAADVARRDLPVDLLGFCDNPYALVRQADVYLITSDFEGQPNGLIEAQGLGVPAVATDCDFGPRDVIADGETGLLVPPGDAAAIAAALQTLLDDAPLRARMGAAARTRARARFGVEHVIDAWERVLDGGAR